MERRNFITKLGYASALWALAPAITSCFQSHREKFKGEIVGANSAIGHKLRDQQFAQPSVTKHVRTLILGAGVAGLSAARTLKKNGDEDFVVIELADQPGGNSASGKMRSVNILGCPLPASDQSKQSRPICFSQGT
ncbi:MAG: NAD(P)-binding protein [Flavobacteriales bacterium]|nr:NAD(P)-binding protein [Flavobacteriales bacterium]